jgi:hypothetical protein
MHEIEDAATKQQQPLLTTPRYWIPYCQEHDKSIKNITHILNICNA